MNIRIGPYRFSPGVFTTLVTIGLLYLMASLGQWQAHKAEYKEKLHASIVARKDLPPVSLAELPKGMEKSMFLPVHLTGKFDPVHYFLLDNVVHDTQVGYDIYSPLHTTSGVTILVNRGFLPIGLSREVLPHVTTPSGIVHIKGLVDKPPSKNFILMKNVNQVKGWPKVLEYIDPKEISGFLHTKVFNRVVWLDAKDPNAFTGHLPAMNLNSAMNTGYAFQWRAMCLALIVIYFYVNTKKMKVTE